MKRTKQSCHSPSLDDADLGSIGSEVGVIDSEDVERVAGGKPVAGFPPPALEHFPADRISVCVAKMR
jgi:hypothetical protein